MCSSPVGGIYRKKEKEKSVIGKSVIAQTYLSYSHRALPSGNVILLGEYIFIFLSPACNKCIILTGPGQYNGFFRILSELVFGLRYTTTTDLQVLSIICQIFHGTSGQIPLNIMISSRLLYIRQNNYHFRPLGACVERTLSFTLYLLQMRKNNLLLV